MKIADEELKKRVLEAIPFGRENTVIADRIHERAGTPPEWRTQFATRSIITQLIMDGHPICAVSGSPQPGYWRTDKVSELIAYVKSLEGRVVGIRTRIEALEKTIVGMGGVLWRQSELGEAR